MPAFVYTLSDIGVPSVTLQHSVFVVLVRLPDINASRSHFPVRARKRSETRDKHLINYAAYWHNCIVVCILYNCVCNVFNDFRSKHSSLSFSINVIDRISLTYRFRYNRITALFTSKDTWLFSRFLRRHKNIRGIFSKYKVYTRIESRNGIFF